MLINLIWIHTENWIDCFWNGDFYILDTYKFIVDQLGMLTANIRFVLKICFYNFFTWKISVQMINL